MKGSKERTENERFIRDINARFFFKEFTYFNTEFRTKYKEEFELADGMVWLDNLLFVFQMKERNANYAKSEDSERKWFKKKILDEAISQIKRTEAYRENYNDRFEFENERGHKLDMSKIQSTELVRLVVYSPSEKLPEDCRFRKFYKLKNKELVHLFHSEDYYWICRYLVTPDEINDYLLFRERFYFRAGLDINSLPEQYFLSHYFSKDRSYKLKANLGILLNSLEEDLQSFDISPLFEFFWDEGADYSTLEENYTILKELAKLGRQELEHFRKRFDKIILQTIKKVKDLPYRMTSARTNCGFVFWNIEVEDDDLAVKAVSNITYAHMYEQKLSKSVGVVAYRSKKDNDMTRLQWCFLESEWKPNASMDRLLKESFPFRPVSNKMLRNYKFKDGESNA